MGKGIESLDRAYGIFFAAVLIILAVLILLCLIRAVIGPRIADRIVSVNMIRMIFVYIHILWMILPRKQKVMLFMFKPRRKLWNLSRQRIIW